MSWYDRPALFIQSHAVLCDHLGHKTWNKVGVVQCTGKLLEHCWTEAMRATKLQNLCRLSIHIIMVIIIICIIIIPTKGAEWEWIGQLSILLNKQDGFINRFCVFLVVFTCFVVFAARCCSVLQLKRDRGSEGLQSLITHPGHSTPTRHSHSRFCALKSL